MSVPSSLLLRACARSLLSSSHVEGKSAVQGRTHLKMCDIVARRGTTVRLPQSISYLSDPENKGKQTSGVNFDTIGSWNNRLDLKIDVEESIRRGKLIPRIDVEKIGMASLIGRRPDNEDRLLAEEIKPNILLCGIFDGHGGKMAADFVEERLPYHILYWLERGEKDLAKILKNAFVEVNNSFTKFLFHSCTKGSAGDQNGGARLLSSGTTATVCLIRNGIDLAVAHVGDSRAVLCRNNNAIRLTEDHEPEVMKEKERIEKCNGYLTWSSLGKSRVNGRLEMTRSIGDVELKPFGVTAEPDVRSLEIQHGNDSFLVLTTDGVHSRLNNGEIIQVISSCINPHEAAKFLADQALLFGSEDNCSALIIPFGAWGKYAETSRQVHFTVRTRNPIMHARS